MKHLAIVVALCAAAGCGKSDPPLSKRSTGTGEPGRIQVYHVLIAFAGAERSTATRGQTDAEVLANEILDRARRGEDFEKLMKEYSNDTGDGKYWLVNYGSIGMSGDNRRSSFAPGFCDVAFKLKVGEVGLAPYDKTRTPHGYHIIKRVD